MMLHDIWNPGVKQSVKPNYNTYKPQYVGETWVDILSETTPRNL